MQQLLLLLLSYYPATFAEREGFTVCYDTQNQRALWTSHQPIPASAPTQKRVWRSDRELNSLRSQAFTNSGYDRGHLVPAADLPDSPDTFLTSNAIPQDPALNRGPWRRLENQIRKHRPARVITGALYNNCVIFKVAFFPNGQILAEFAQNAEPRANAR